MTGVFGDYARFYELLYAGKPYAEEAAWVLGRLQAHGARPATMLDLGCGAGHHALAFAGAGIRVTGVDMSQAMLDAAGTRRAGAAPEIAARATFELGDARNVRLARPFGAVVALFHVISYQTSEADLEAAIATAAAHLPPGGLFGFDVWHGPAVLADPPRQRIKRASEGGQSVVRLTEPEHHPEAHVVDVNFTMFVQTAGETTWRDIRETHRMRYWFEDEIAAALARGGFDLLASEEWMTDKPPGTHSFSVFHVARRR